MERGVKRDIIVSGEDRVRRPPAGTQMTLASTHSPRIPTPIVIAAALAGAILGLFEIANTSIGWHLASGDWVLSNQAFLYADPFSFTSGGALWINHEWLFQVGASIAYSLAGPIALVLLRALTIAALATLLLVVGVRSGLSPAAAVVLSLLCVAGARGRFFVRPELVTLVIVPTAVWLYLRRERSSSPVWLAALAGLMIVGANAHGGALVVPLLFAGILAAEGLQMALTRHWSRETIISGIAGFATAVLALLVNPYGWHLFTVPLRLAHLVDQDHIPNPEWISPSPVQAPVLYAAIAISVVVLALRERRLAYWALLLMATALALRHIRNLGLFFVLLPLAVAPALATWRALSTGREESKKSHRRANLLAVTAVSLLAVSLAIAPWPQFGIGFADTYYPNSACSFLDAQGLPTAQLYNDVRFGGYLIHRYGPERQVFQDDRNEIHEPLLRRIWEIFRASDVAAWSELLGSYSADTALVRYHPQIHVTDPAGNDLGNRGFSTLWFPAAEWALVYWDDVAMVFVRRDSAPPGVVERHEYHVIRPDDIAHLEDRLADDPALRRDAAEELARAVRSIPTSSRAREIAELIRR
jgi:hypothetical protein